MKLKIYNFINISYVMIQFNKLLYLVKYCIPIILRNHKTINYFT